MISRDLRLSHLFQDCLMESIANTLKGNSLHYWVKEPLHNQTLRLLLWYAARFEIKEWLLLEFANSRAMRAADIVRQDF